MKYEIWYNAIDGDYYKTSDTLEEESSSIELSCQLLKEKVN